MASNFHAFFSHVLFGITLVFPIIFLSLKAFKIKNPRQRMGFYTLGLVLPLISLTLFYTILTKRCEMGYIRNSNYFFDLICKVGINFIFFIGPIILGLILLALIKGVIGGILLYRFRLEDRGCCPEKIRVEKIITERCMYLNQKVPRVLLSRKDGFAAMVMGWVNPVIIINSVMVNELSDSELDMMITHELIHIRRGDCFIGWFFHLIRDIMFFNPLSTLLLKNYLTERERLCDKETAELLGNPRAYAATLLKVWRILVDKEDQVVRTVVSFIGNKNEMEYRILSLVSGEMVNPKLSFKKLMAIKIIIITLVVTMVSLIC
ncbi:BlaR1 peptidase M56 [Natranaerovirga pectinivora]|uniref:BlaR1 peptidase M56 n=1 Tax=Natranaerovirga pectinivora TaxID=682400 RepID=A0A4R3MNP8_9FIRM|nr:M56 family metallopeptidase [Natranaerovirga pectinivora]TCT16150.1 BlaR1 peptidase M56 [Natranaerovirga pectinivora]